MRVFKIGYFAGCELIRCSDGYVLIRCSDGPLFFSKRYMSYAHKTNLYKA